MAESAAEVCGGLLCPYQLQSRTCKCKPLCAVCGWGKHAAIHQVKAPYPHAHAYATQDREGEPT